MHSSYTLLNDLQTPWARTITQSTDTRTRHHHSAKPTGSLIWSLYQPDSFVGVLQACKGEDKDEDRDEGREEEKTYEIMIPPFVATFAPP